MLEQAGALVSAIDLPGHGQDSADLKTASMTDYVDAVRGAVIRLHAACGEPVTLVGHSMGGVVVTHAALALGGSLVGRTVYVSAFVPGGGESALELADRDSGSQVAVCALRVADGVCVIGDVSRAAGVFYEKCSAADASWAAGLLGAESYRAVSETLPVSPESLALLNTGYIECLRDRVVTITAQRRMWAGLRSPLIRTIDTDHSPFLSAPRQLADHLLAMAPGGCRPEQPTLFSAGLRPRWVLSADRTGNAMSRPSTAGAPFNVRSQA